MVNLNTILVLFLCLSLSIVLKCDSLKNRCPTLRIENARIRINGRIARINCNTNFKLVRGRNRITCIGEEWIYSELPVCAKIYETYLACDFESSNDRFCGWKNGIFNDVDWLADRSRLLFSIGRHVSPGSSQYFTGNYISLDAGTYGSGVTGQLLSPPIQPVNEKQICLIFSFVVRSGKSYGTISSPILSVTFGGIPLWETSVGEGRVIIGLYKLDVSSTIIIKGKNCEAAIDNLIVTEDDRCTEQPYNEAINSCQDYCGIKTNAAVSSCSCDWECFDNENCCLDIEKTCPYIKPPEEIVRLYFTTTSTTTTTTTTSTTTTTTTTTITPPPLLTDSTTTITPRPLLENSTTIITSTPPLLTNSTTTNTPRPLLKNSTTTITPRPLLENSTNIITLPPFVTNSTTIITPITSTATIPIKITTVENNSTYYYTRSSLKVIHNFPTLNVSTRVTTQTNLNKDTIHSMSLPPTFITFLNITYSKFPPTTPMTITKKPITIPAIISSNTLSTKVPLNSITMSSMPVPTIVISNTTIAFNNTPKVTTRSVMETNRLTIKALINAPTTTVKPLKTNANTISTIKSIDIPTKSTTKNTAFMTTKLPLLINITSTPKLINSSTIRKNITEKSSTPTGFEPPSTSLHNTISSNINGINKFPGINKEKPTVTNLTTLVLNITYTSTVIPKTTAVNHNISFSSSINLKHKNILKHSTLSINKNPLSITTENTNSNLKFNKPIEIPHEKTKINYELNNEQRKNADNRLENPGEQNDKAKYSNKINNLITISMYFISIAVILITLKYTLSFIYSYFKFTHMEINSCFIQTESDNSCNMELISNS